MLLSRYHVPTLKEIPSDAEVISHQLMLRAGMIRKLAAGIYSVLPLGYRVIRKIENIVREEMERAGAQEVLLPAVQPAELWIESGRWNHYGPELLRLRDRHSREFCFGPTHEEVITDLVKRDVRSYRELPLNLFQIQTKFRDEIRPRFGLMRCREFSMKDAYSFDVDDENAEKSYIAMKDAYERIFARCKLKFRSVEADSGNIGGKFSHEFMVLADTGEDLIVSCNHCDYAANIEKAQLSPIDRAVSGKASLKKVDTPNQRTVEEVTSFLGFRPEDLIKTLIVLADGKPVAALLRGDHELNLIKLRRELDAELVELADPATIEKVTNAPVGFAGPIGLHVPIIADYAIAAVKDTVIGGNALDVHYVGANLDRDYSVTRFADIRNASAGDPCPICGKGTYVVSRGIEVGHIFKLGTKYSEIMRCTFLDENGNDKPMIMGCYGIGIGRTAAAAIEQNHDENGIIWPLPIAPFEVMLLALNIQNSSIRNVADKLYREMTAKGVQVLYDERDERPGVKFKDSDLLGIPMRITIGEKSLKENKVEMKTRNSSDIVKVSSDEVVNRVSEWIGENRGN